MKQLVNYLKADASVIREMLASLQKAGKVIKTGNRRSTKYAIAGTPKPDEGAEVTEESIFEAVKKAEKPVSRKYIAEELKTYEVKITDLLHSLVDKGKVAFNGKKRGKLYWVAGNSDIASSMDTQFVQQVDGSVAEVKVVKINDLDQLIREGLSNVAPGDEMDVLALTEVIDRFAEHPFTRLEVMQGLVKASKTMPTLKAEMKRTPEGYRAMYCVQ